MSDVNHLGWDFPAPFTLDITVQPGDIDALQHVNNVTYLGWLEAVSWAHSKSLDLDWDTYERLGVACVVRRHELDYLAPTHLGDELVAATWVSRNDGRLSLWRRFQIIRPADGVTVLRGHSHFVSVRLDNGRPCRMPKEFSEGYRVMIEET
ncbi:thioesterase family protein [Spectribacter hydrogenoxidans]|uniref:Thioesterase family protein n=1 Tax=Spectribacter hydrogenoxidans TaxID=3075608 RepID=A0ABU3C228_9GAMM|nr:thioesterase family protein [Salinisphaera sp. W335]MDT0635621.1 thioesterase family protein [Salinisphaera sp. W335]